MCLGPLIRREAPAGRPAKEQARKSDRRDTEGSEREGRKKKIGRVRGEKAGVKVKERRLDLESGCGGVVGGDEAKIAGRPPLTHSSQGDEGRRRE